MPTTATSLIDLAEEIAEAARQRDENADYLAALDTCDDAIAQVCPWCSPTATGAAILALFAGRKFKALKLGALRISRAGANSSNPNGLWIAIGRGESNLYLGSVRADGSMRMSRDGASSAYADTRETLKRLAAFGAAELAKVGRETGSCCYCARELTDPDSINLGYGPVCAVHHGLPHPNRHGF